MRSGVQFIDHTLFAGLKKDLRRILRRQCIRLDNETMHLAIGKNMRFDLFLKLMKTFFGNQMRARDIHTKHGSGRIGRHFRNCDIF